MNSFFHEFVYGVEMAGNKNLNQAKIAQKDEFYTQLTDIEKEVRYYKNFFADKTVLCNCDDPFESNFFKYFVLNFNRLGLKKLIATCYVTSPVANQQLSIFDVIGDTDHIPTENGTPYKAVITTVYDKTGDGGVDMFDIAELFKSGENELSPLNGDGDFRSKECVDLLDESDIVVTNPPFSLFIEYITQLISKNKSFLIIGNLNALHYKEIFPLIKDNKVWLGISMDSSNRYFRVPDSYELTEKTGKIVDGIKYAFVKGCLWFTNMDNRIRHEELILVKKYNPEIYPTYENYDAIDVKNVNDIPEDYFGKMGVPDSFLRKYNPDQFEIIGLGAGNLAKEIGIKKNYRGRTDVAYRINGVDKCPYSRIIIRRRDSKGV